MGYMALDLFYVIYDAQSKPLDAEVSITSFVVLVVDGRRKNKRRKMNAWGL